MNIQIMKIYHFKFEICALLVFVLCGDEALGSNGSGVSTRQKRALVFPLGGTFKLVIGVGTPIKLSKTRTISVGWNFQWQYPLPLVIGVGTPIKLSKTRTISVGWNFQWQYPLPVNTSVIHTYPPILSRKTREDTDIRRKEIYDAVENFLVGHNVNLKDCLVRYICEEAYSSFKHHSNGPYGELLHIILAPDEEEDLELNQVYQDARQAGKFGADCFDLYPNCEESLLMSGLFSLDFT